VNEELDLIEPLMRENKLTNTYVEKYVNDAKEMRRLIRDDVNGFLELCNSLKISMGRDPDFQYADEWRYRAFEALRGRWVNS
jgi:hypothetical protein